MSNYPAQYDDDSTIIRIDDNIDELGTEAINQIREAIFAEQATLGLNPQGTKASVAERLDVSLNSNGTIKTSAIASIGLVTLPIDDAQIGISASIQESKLNLDYATSDLNTLIQTNSTLISSLQAFATITSNDLTLHIGGASALSGGGICRHIDNQIDLQGGGSYIVDINGTPRGVTTVQQALSAINTDLVNHQNDTVAAHAASAILVDTSGFTEIPETAVDVQSALDAIDDSDRLQIGVHRAVMHSNGVPKSARSEDPENIGYGINVVPYTSCRAYLGDGTNSPNDSTTNGDNVIKFLPTISSPYDFDKAFTQVKLGDVLRINYGNGFESQFLIESIRYTPGVDFTVRINGINLFDTDGYDAVARIDRPLFDENLYGVFAVAAANNDIHSDILGSVIVGNPRAASAVGIGFDPNQLNSTHYNLYLNLFPTGNPQDKVIQTIGIDVTGNLGASPGKYTIDTVVQATNDSLRKAGWNQRFLAFSYKGEFGIMLADIINNASFSIINGIVSGGALATGSFSNNVIGDATDGLDALGLGVNRANVASPTVSSYTTPEAAANLPLLVHSPRRNRNAVVNGINVDNFAETPFTTDGYWSAIIYSAGVVGSSYQITYEVELDLSICDLAPGKTITAQPAISFTDPLYTNVDYGRFVIRNVEFIPPCGPTTACTRITVVNGTANTGNALFAGSAVGTEVLLYFGEDSVGFNALNVSDVSTGNQYNRLHEVYATDEGKTFTHERARMIKQAGTSTLLNTADIGGGSPWTIVNVSPKLRGWRDDSSPSSTDFTKKVRFFVVNYISTTGEYDGYIGRASRAGVVEYGEVVRARKNVPARFYDATNVDYIELEFIERESAVATPITPDTSPRYVDIDIFPSLKLDDEVFLLATCEMDNLYVERVVDRREFGNVSEKDFSTSAISFIQAGDRHLHTNGVIRGLGFRENGTVAGTLRFNGGVALINGAIVTINDGLVSIPEVRDASSATVTWAVCVNEAGQFVAVLITTDKKQFFTSNRSPNYYVPSMTFFELLTARKDLVPVATVIAIIASITLVNVLDARRFVVSQTMDIPLSIYQRSLGADGYEVICGSFEDLLQADNWLYFTSEFGSLIKVRGSVSAGTLNEFESSVIFDGEESGAITFGTGDSTFTFSNHVTFKDITVNVNGILNMPEGCLFENCTINVSSTSTSVFKPLLCRYNAVFRNCTINITAISVVGYTTGDEINAAFGGVIHADGSVDSENIVIENCKFENQTAAAQLPPYVNIAVFDTGRNILIKNNRFINKNNYYCCSVCIEAISNSSALENVVVDQNNAEHIMLCPRLISDPGFFFKGVSVTNNSCNGIGFLSTTSNSPSNINISNNSCNIICTAKTTYDSYGYYSPVYGCRGNVLISGNSVRGMVRIGLSPDIARIAAVNITNNEIVVTNKTVLNQWFNSTFPSIYGIYVSDSSVNGNATKSLYIQTVISGNRVRCYESPVFAGGGIECYGNSVIESNHIWSNTGALIGVRNGYGTTKTIVRGNHLYRNGAEIYHYINCGPNVVDSLVVDNILDSSFVDVANTDYANAIKVSNYDTTTIQRNKKHRVFDNINGWSLNQRISTGPPGALIIKPSITDVANVVAADQASILYLYTYDVAASTTVEFTSTFNIAQFLPDNVKVVNVSCAVYTDAGFWSSGTITLSVSNGVSGMTDSIDVLTTDEDILSVNPNLRSNETTVQFINSVTRNGAVGNIRVTIALYGIDVIYEY